MVKLADENHDVFKVYFPSNPLLLGFMMLEICAEVLEHEIIAIKKSK